MKISLLVCISQNKLAKAKQNTGPNTLKKCKVKTTTGKIMSKNSSVPRFIMMALQVLYQTSSVSE